MTDSPPDPGRYCVIGHPVSHSRSPWIHARFAAQTGQALRYTAEDSPEDGFAATLHALRQQGLHGANVTVPFKLQAFTLAQVRSQRAKLAQAANTLTWHADGRLHADNTDGTGLVRDITANAGMSLAGAHILLLGAGGASAGVLGVLIEQRPASITVANRSTDKAVQLVQRHQPHAQPFGVALHACSLAEALTADALPPSLPARCHLLINGTSSSLGGEALHVPASRFADGALAYDMMYGPAARPFLEQAARCGATVRDGLGMLVEQAAESFRIWRGVQPATAPVLHELRALVDAPSAGNRAHP